MIAELLALLGIRHRYHVLYWDDTRQQFMREYRVRWRWQ